MAETPGIRRLRRLVWLLPVAFALHEAEEWNIVPWFQAHFAPRTELSDLGARTLLVAFSLAAFLYTGLASLLPSTRAWLLAVLPLFVLAGFGNALTHLFWWLYFGAYAPGVLSAGLLVAPLTIYVALRAVRERLVPAWYAGALFLFALAPLAAVARAGSTLTPEQLALHDLATRLAKWLWGTA
jgi:hypothetical protein